MTPEEEAKRLIAEYEAAQQDRRPIRTYADDQAGPDNKLYSDSGNAERLIALADGKARYEPSWGLWLTWDGQRWTIDHSDLQAQELAKGIAAQLRTRSNETRNEKAQKALHNWSIRSENVHGITGTIKLARSSPGIAISHTQLDDDPWTLNCQNGLLDLRTMILHAPNPDSLVTKLAGCAYDQAAPAPHFHQFLTDTFPDPEVLAYTQRYIGYCLTGDVTEQQISMWWGAGRNGKSTLINIVAAMLGDYAVTIGRDILIAQKHESHDTKFVDLFRSRLAVCVELKETERLDASRIKALTGGDTIMARRMRENYWRFHPTHKLLVATNHKPRADAKDFALWRRIHLVPFTKTVEETDVDPQLANEIIANELPGVLAWAAQGCLEYQQHRLAAPKAVVDATQSYKNETDTVEQFLTNCGIQAGPQVAGETSSTAFRAAHDEWCEDAGENPRSHWNKVSAHLKQEGCVNRRVHGGRLWSHVSMPGITQETTQYDR